MSSPIILGIDPGLARLGWAAAPIGSTDPIRVGIIRTEPSAKKKNVRQAEDTARRAREIYWALLGIGNQLGDVVVVASEAKSFPRNASAAAKLSLAIGQIIALSCHWRASLVQATPQDIKKVLCGRSNASKRDVEAAVHIDEAPGIEEVNKSERDHVADAIGVLHAVQDSEVIRALRRAA